MLSIRYSVVAALIVALPLLAQDKQAEKKKPETPNKVEPKDKPEKKDEKKTPPAKKNYVEFGKAVGLIKKVDVAELKIEIDAPSGRGYAQVETYTLADDVKVRMLELPVRLDERNRPVPYTAQEKQKLKGDNPRLPGYTTELSALKPGVQTEMHLSINKPGPNAAKNKSGPEKPFVTMIIIPTLEPKAAESKSKKK